MTLFFVLHTHTHTHIQFGTGSKITWSHDFASAFRRLEPDGGLYFTFRLSEFVATVKGRPFKEDWGKVPEKYRKLKPESIKSVGFAVSTLDRVGDKLQGLPGSPLTFILRIGRINLISTKHIF